MEESSTYAWIGDHSCHAQRTDDGVGWDARSWTDARCFECIRSAEVRRHRSAGDPPQWTGYLVYCSGECGGENSGKKGQGGVGIAVRTSITRAARPPEFISDRLRKVSLELRGRAKAATFFVACAPAETQNASNKHTFWTTLDRLVEEVPRHDQLFVLMNANARTDRREKGGEGSKDNKVLGAYGRDTLNDNGELLLSFANNHDLAIVNAFFSTPKGGVSHTLNVRGKNSIDYV